MLLQYPISKKTILGGTHSQPTAKMCLNHYNFMSFENSSDCEFIELVLSISNSQRDVKKIAKDLLERFGDFNHTISADPHELLKIEGVDYRAIHVLKVLEASAHKMGQTRLLKTNVISSWGTLIDYCKTTMAYHQTEVSRTIFLNNENYIITDELHQKGNINETDLYPREIMKRGRI